MQRVLLVAGLLGMASPAGASECPALWQQVNVKMSAAHAELSPEDQTRVAELRRQGEDFHHAGDHAKAAAALNEALALLG